MRKPFLNIRAIGTAALFALASFALILPSAFAANPDDELWVTIAGHGPGAEGSFWVTDLFIMNPDDEDSIEVEITFLPQGVDNTEAEGMTFEIEARATLVLEDVVETLVGDQAIFGALHIEVLDEDDPNEPDEKGFFSGGPPSSNQVDVDDFLEEDVALMVHARVYDLQDEGSVARGDSVSRGDLRRGIRHDSRPGSQ